MLVAEVAAYVSLGILGQSGLSHVAYYDELVAALRTQGMWSERIVRPVAAFLVVAELVVPVAALLALLWVLPRELIAWSLIAAVALFASFSAITAYLTITKPEASCACGRRSGPVTVYVAVRAFILLLASVSALVLLRDGAGLSVHWVSVAVSVPLGIVIWIFPAAAGAPTHRLSTKRIESWT